MKTHFTLLFFLFSCFVFGQNNLINNYSFQLGEYGTNSPACDYFSSWTDFDSQIANWRYAKHGTEIASSPDWLSTTNCINSLPWNNILDNCSNNADDFKFLPTNRCVYLAANDGDFHEAIYNGLADPLEVGATYILKIKANPMSKPCIDVCADGRNQLKFIFSEYGANWPHGDDWEPPNAVIVEYLVANNTKSWKQYYFEITMPTGHDDLDNIILYAESGSFLIDDVELYKKEDCIDNIYVQNKTYDGYFYNSSIQGLPFYTSAQENLYAGFNVDGNQTYGNVTIKNGASITYEAGLSIFLENGFKVEEGAYFEAHITPCTSSKSQAISSENSSNPIVENVEMTNESSITKSSIIVYPNPAIKTLYFNVIINYSIVEVFDISGKLLLKKQLDSRQLDISNLSQGLYFIKLETNEGMVVKKFIKE
jgi:hypothetical protein